MGRNRRFSRLRLILSGAVPRESSALYRSVVCAFLRLCRIRRAGTATLSQALVVQETLESGGLCMNWDRIEGNWMELKGKVHQQWGKLTNDDLETIHGKRIELAGRLQRRYGVAKDEAERQIDNWLKTMH
jgi:uncharacterized protein YjbJ (UPF0337 family)